MRANLWLRTASRVLVRVAQFKATAFFELEKRAKKIPWEQFVAPGRSAEFRVTAKKSKLYHSDAIAERLQKAARSWRAPGSGLSAAKGGKSQPTAQSPQLFVVRVHHDEFTISADTSGELLHRRGYRQAVGKAPLRETLGAALLLAAEWNGETPLLDPFCGSGTIPIEGAMIARRIAPGLHRHFAFMDWPDFDYRSWRQLRDRARSQQLTSAPAPILGSDRDAGAIESARANAERAGVAADVELSVRAVSAIEPPNTLGQIAANPPYGKRVSEGADLRELYAQFGRVLRERCRGWRVALYSPEPRLAKQVGLPLKEVLRTSNGGIPVVAVVGAVPSADDNR